MRPWGWLGALFCLCDGSLARADEEPEARIGGSVGVELLRPNTSGRGIGRGPSLSLTMKFERPKIVAQLGYIAWQEARISQRDTAYSLPDPELFLSGSIFPFGIGPVDFGIYALVSSQNVLRKFVERGALGLTLQLSLGSIFALRFQVGCSSIQTIYAPSALISALQLDVTFPYE